MDRDCGPLGACVVNSLLQVLENPTCHGVFCDNIFSTGTIRVNRLNNAPLPPTKSMEKKARGTIEVCSTNDICAVCWVDKKVVTLASNNLNP